MQPNGSAEWPRLHSFVVERCRFLAAPSHSHQKQLAGPNLVQAPVPARVSAGLSSPGLAITSCRHRGWRVSAPKLLLLHLACTATTAARCLTPRSSRAPTACHAGHLAQGLRPILRQPPSAPHRRRQLSSNVRQRKVPLSACLQMARPSGLVSTHSSLNVAGFLPLHLSPVRSNSPGQNLVRTSLPARVSAG